MYANVLILFQEQAGNLWILRPAAEHPAVVLHGGGQDQHRHGHVAKNVHFVPFELFAAFRPRDVRVRAGTGRLTNDPVVLVRGQRLGRVEDFHREGFYWI